MGVKRWVALILVGIAFIAIGTNQDHSLRAFVVYVRQLTATHVLYASVGVFLIVIGFVLLVRSLAVALAPERKGDLGEFVWRNRVRLRGPRVVAVGGGTGLSVLLKGMKGYTTNLTAVVTVADDGGSSGRLRQDLGMLPPGDVRNCLVALARSEDLLSRLFQYRFDRGGDLAGHSFGNLLIAALTEITGDFMQAIKFSAEVLAIAGEVLPSTCQNVSLLAVLENGEQIEGETKISQSGKRLREITLSVKDPKPPPAVIERLREAEVIVLGPGSLFTSVIPNLLVPQIAEAINRASAPVVYVANVMTQPGETDGFSLNDHLEAIFRHTSLRRLDYALVNSGHIDPKKVLFYGTHGATPVVTDEGARARLGNRIVPEDLVNVTDYIRHDSSKLALSLMKLVQMKMTRGVRVLRARRAG